ncbi:hypothetical protein DIJ64_00740 [Mycobacterium leprae]|uniref:Uncharacterized protein n=1 Tax=Mycobacterium leprae TaxID=1769 RepID=A0AAD0P4B6_MYCLR|nr:hypothetical protein DIJ64_00740 [Mycobacterium leprae]OAR20690.1 hypothetical protein A8144_09625 [Mycobacterium leprae 3125609]OAX70436.1 hypothetical protein A3216_11955 [Mycobacterium leprae 7935681]
MRNSDPPRHKFAVGNEAVSAFGADPNAVGDLSTEAIESLLGNHDVTLLEYPGIITCMPKMAKCRL